MLGWQLLPHLVGGDACVTGLRELVSAVALPAAVAEQLQREAVDTGAVDVRGCTRSDWLALLVWAQMRDMERRRFWRALGQANLGFLLTW